jgi:hypothetical protein
MVMERFERSAKNGTAPQHRPWLRHALWLVQQ